MKTQVANKKKDTRSKIILIALIAITAIVATKILLLDPAKKSRDTMRENKKTIETENDNLCKEIVTLQGDANLLTKRIDTLEDLLEIKDYVLSPKLGNLQLAAEGFVHEWAKKAGIAAISTTPIAAPRTKRTKTKTLPLLKAYTTRLKFRSDFFAACRFVRIIREENPYCYVYDFLITSDKTTPLAHNVQVTVQWPVWSGGAFPKEYLDQLSAAAVKK